VVSAAACGNSGPSDGALAGKTATSITSLSIRAYHKQHSVQFFTKTVAGKNTTLLVGASSTAGEASETVTTNGDPVIEAVVVDRVAYVRTTEAVLQQSFSLSATTAASYSGKWISLVTGDAAYQSIVNSLSPTQAITQFVPEEPNLKVSGATSIGGKQAVAVSGASAGGAPNGATSTSTLFVSTTAPYLPISATVVVKSAEGKSVERVASVYGKWNERVDPIAPKGATPMSTLST
jgi:hypothetical protein